MKEKDIMVFAGAWSHMQYNEIEQMKERIITLRKISTKELLKNQHK